jgi:hypothetical protein
MHERNKIKQVLHLITIKRSAAMMVEILSIEELVLSVSYYIASDVSLY